MRFAGSASWRFEHDDAGDLHYVLLARDAAGLSPPPSPDLPPSLVPDLLDGVRPAGDLLPTRAARDRAATQWLHWWRGLAGIRAGQDESQPRADRRDEAAIRAWLHAAAERWAVAFDPPEFGSLAATPELRTIATATFADAQRLFNDRRQQQTGRRRYPPVFDWHVVRAAAEQAAVDHDVPIGDIDGAAHVLDVVGRWWYLAGPGRAFCSAETAADAAAAYEVLTAIFASRLGRPRPG